MIYTRAKTSGETTESLRARHNDLMKWKFLEAVEFLRLFVQTGVMFLLVAGCEFTRSLSVSVGWVLTSILTVIEAVFLWHLVVSWIAAFSLSKPTTRGSLGDMDTLVQDDETLRTWMRGELMEMDGEAVISCVHHILQVRMGQVVKSFGDLGNVEKISLQGRLALLQILNDALRDEIYQWEVDKEVSWTSWIGEAVVGVDNILQSAPYAPEFKLQAEVNGELLVKLLAQDVATAKRVMFHLTSCLDPMVGQKFPLITSSPSKHHY